MADTDEARPAESPPGPDTAAAPATRHEDLKPLLLLCAGIVILAAGAGYGTAMLLKGPKTADASTPAVETPTKTPAATTTHTAAGTHPPVAKGDFYYYDFEPIVVNLDEPRLARYVRVTITLAIRPEETEAARTILEKRKPELKNWLTVFFASCTLEQIRGAANLNRLRREILDSLNDQLWPDQKSPIHHVLFKDLAVS
jgi:flagellar basal body-associated protein FliL